jgi:hypothetical protein
MRGQGAVSDTAERLADRVLATTREGIVAHLRQLELAGVIDRIDTVAVDRVAATLVDVTALALGRDTGPSALARRIGPIYTAGDLARWLPPAGAAPLSDEAVRKRAKGRHLVGFLTDDHRWAFPAWQFDQIGGQLVPRRAVVELWRQLPTDGFLTDVDLAAWMASRLRSLDDATPAEHAHRYGADDPRLAGALARLLRRAAA